MATAKKEPADFKVILTLTREEAEMLFDVMHKVGGDPTDSPRRHANAISSALFNLGLTRISPAAQGGITYREF